MGKKFKQSAAQKAQDVRPEKPQKMEQKNGAADLMGLSAKSKNIKKAHKSEMVLPKVRDAVANSGAGNVDGTVSKKKKKHNKHKKPASESVAVEGQPEVKVEQQPGSDGSKKSKKHKKKKNKQHTNGTQAAEPQQPVGKVETGTKDASKESKKHKKNKNKKQTNGTQAEESQQPAGEADTAQEAGTKDASKKSKKHKKKNKDLPNEPMTEQSEQTTVEANETDASKKSKKHKRKASKVEPTEVAEETPKKKHKKKNKHGKDPANGAKDEELQPPVEEPKVKKAKQEPHVKVLEADQDVVTSESESDDDDNDDDAAHKEMDQVNEGILKEHSAKSEKDGDKRSDQKAKDQEAKEEKKERRFKGPEHSIFIGNLPKTVKKSTMKSLFNQYGKILTIRFRTNDGVTLFKKKDRKEAKALNCYIRFETRPEAQAACAMNGQLVEGNRIRVTIHTQKQMGHASSTVFVGNINRKTTDNELYDFFSRVGELEYVRQIADKGIGYVCFKKGVSIAKALKLNQQLLNGRPLRISRVDPNKQHQRRNKKGNLVQKHRGGGGKPPAAAAGEKTGKQEGSKPKPPVKDFHGSVAENKKGKKHNKMKKGGGADKKKKLLAQKLTAAGASRNK